jgi:hypothetical protein
VGSVPILGTAATRDGPIAVIEQGRFHAYADEDFRGKSGDDFNIDPRGRAETALWIIESRRSVSKLFSLATRE